MTGIIDRELARRIREVAERRLTASELDALLGLPIGASEREEVLSLVDWFCSRYPTPAERLAYARQAHRRWTQALPEARATHGRPEA